MLGFLTYALIGWLSYGLCLFYMVLKGDDIGDICPDFNWEITRLVFAICILGTITFIWPLGFAFGILWHFDEIKG